MSDGTPNYAAYSLAGIDDDRYTEVAHLFSGETASLEDVGVPIKTDWEIAKTMTP